MIPQIEMFAGDDKTVEILAETEVVTEVDGVYLKSVVPIDLEGGTVFFGIETEGGFVLKEQRDHEDAVNGKSSISLEPKDTRDLEPRIYNYIIRIQLRDGQISTLGKNKLIVKNSIIPIADLE